MAQEAIEVFAPILIQIGKAVPFRQPDYIKRLVRGSGPLKSGVYCYRFERFLLDGERDPLGDEVLEYAAARQAASGLQAALHLLKNQHLIPAELRDRYLVFAGVVMVHADGYWCTLCLEWLHNAWRLQWLWLSYNFPKSGLLISTEKFSTQI